MEYMVWTDGYSVNVKAIDVQHKKLVEMINTLHAAMSDNSGARAQKHVVNEMVNYAMTHFATEEKYMQQFKYSGYEAHKNEHDVFSKKAMNLKQRFSDGNYILTVEILFFLRNWLYKHIMGTDKQYTKCFNEHGLN